MKGHKEEDMVSGDEGWHLLVTALSYQALPLAAGTLIQLHTLDLDKQ